MLDVQQMMGHAAAVGCCKHTLALISRQNVHSAGE